MLSDGGLSYHTSRPRVTQIGDEGLTGRRCRNRSGSHRADLKWGPFCSWYRVPAVRSDIGGCAMKRWDASLRTARISVSSAASTVIVLPRVRRRGSCTGRQTVAVVLREPGVSWINLHSQRCQNSGATLPEAAKGLSRVQHARGQTRRVKHHRTPGIHDTSMKSRSHRGTHRSTAKGKECDQPSARAVQLRRAASTRCQLVPTHRSIMARGSEIDLPRLVSS